MANEEHPLSNLMGTTLEKIHEMVDSNTIIGKPINTDKGVTIVPVSRVSFGFGAGGSDIPSAKVTRELFGGASAAGVTIAPIAFLVIGADGDVKLVQVAGTAGTASQALNMLPEVVDKITSMIKGKKKDGKEEDKHPHKKPAPKQDEKAEDEPTISFSEEIIDIT